MIEKVHGLQSTSISLNDRFTFLATTAPIVRIARPRRRSSGMYSLNQNANRLLIEQIAQRLGQQSKWYAVQQRLGLTGLRRFGSESNLARLPRYNSFSYLNPNRTKNRVSWRQSNGNISGSSFHSVSPSPWRGRGFRRRGGRMGLMRGRFRGRGGRQQLVGRLHYPQNNQQRNQRGRGRGRGWGRGRGRGRGRSGRGTQTQKQVPTKEELDLQLDQYMASTKMALDKELDDYMKTTMEE